jgi:hypothetical protein
MPPFTTSNIASRYGLGERTDNVEIRVSGGIDDG